MFYRSDVDDRLEYLSERYPKQLIDLVICEKALCPSDIARVISDVEDIDFDFAERLVRALSYVSNDDFMTVLGCLVDIDYLACCFCELIASEHSDCFAAGFLRYMELAAWDAGWRGYRDYECVMETW